MRRLPGYWVVVFAANPPVIGAIVSACFGVFILCLLDATMKGVSISLGAYNAMLWRQVAGVALSGTAYILSGAPKPSRETLRLNCVRGILGAVMAVTFFWGLVRIPLAEAAALSFIAPLMTLFLASAILKERIGRQAIFASLLGFAGVLIILGNQLGGDRFSRDAVLGMFAILISAALYAYNLILQRQTAQIGPPIQNVFFLNLFAVMALSIFAPFFGAIPLAEQWPQIGLSAFFAFAGLAIMAWAYARAEAQVLAPIEYSGFIWAVLLGWIFFGERVAASTVLGSALIILACYLASRQQAQTSD
jgi:S-adenosylmethionine uptake transporter